MIAEQFWSDYRVLFSGDRFEKKSRVSDCYTKDFKAVHFYGAGIFAASAPCILGILKIKDHIHFLKA